ncbi:MAG TPA: PrgI family protein [Candidatus Saccharibacteria bacterium]|nr:PrgI family protein [Candidatus Saccharibacteria bacterium]HRK94001.1 PrgI family protein [Candidatus Saccharibacteria bacterium]
MAVYKVPQDVEADDKLIGPFSFRQFIYLLIVAAAGGIGYFLSQLFFPLFVVVLPVVVFFGALALPLRKDQPMETYLAALVSFYLKPHRRLWNPDGTQALVEITAPKVVEVQRTKDLSQSEAEQRLSYLASIVDSRGWAARGVQAMPGQEPSGNGVMTTDAYFDAMSAPDMLDDTTGVGQALDSRLDQAAAQRHQEMLSRVQQQAAQPAPVAQPVATAAPVAVADPYASLSAPAPEPAAAAVPEPAPNVAFNPYPTMHQSVIAPIDPKAAKPAGAPEAEKTGEKALSPDIINLANNPDLSVETIAREANRIHEKEKLSEDEVVISLR